MRPFGRGPALCTGAGSCDMVADGVGLVATPQRANS
jgi:hypothetical protein